MAFCSRQVFVRLLGHSACRVNATSLYNLLILRRLTDRRTHATLTLSSLLAMLEHRRDSFDDGLRFVTLNRFLLCSVSTHEEGVGCVALTSHTESPKRVTRERRLVRCMIDMMIQMPPIYEIALVLQLPRDTCSFSRVNWILGKVCRLLATKSRCTLEIKLYSLWKCGARQEACQLPRMGRRRFSSPKFSKTRFLSRPLSCSREG